MPCNIIYYKYYLVYTKTGDVYIAMTDLKLSIIDYVPPLKREGNRMEILKRREGFWIKRLGTIFPRGLNLDYPLHVFLSF